MQWKSGLIRRVGSFDTTLCDKVRQWLSTGLWISPSTLILSINKTDSHDITEILLKVALNTITLTPVLVMLITSSCGSLVRDSSATRRLFVRLAGAVGRQSALHKENSGFAAPTRHISTFRGYQILFSIRNPYINRFTNHFSIHSQPSYPQKVVLHSITTRFCLRPYHFAIWLSFYVQTQTSVILIEYTCFVSTINMYYEYMTTQYFVRFFILSI
jgi:hypothetical protein